MMEVSYSIGRYFANFSDCTKLNKPFLRDSKEPLKCLTQEERNEIDQRERNRLGLFSVKNYYSLSGRERALKIYLDNSPSKSEDAD